MGCTTSTPIVRENTAKTIHLLVNGKNVSVSRSILLSSSRVKVMFCSIVCAGLHSVLLYDFIVYGSFGFAA